MIVWFSNSLRLTALVLVLGGPLVIHAEDFTYTTTNGTITITGYTGPGGEVDIPSSINGLPVTGIGDYAFASKTPTTVKIPESVSSIGGSAFAKCSSLVAITVAAPNRFFSSVDGVLFDKSLTLLVRCPGGKAGDYTTTKSTKTLGDSAFEGCTSLTSVTVLDGVTSLANGVFANCVALTNVTLPDTVTSIGWWLFAGCSSLKSLRIPENVTSIGPWTFASFSGLTSVTIPDGVTNIDAWAFQDCSSLSSVTLGNGVTAVPKSAFARCGNLTSVSVAAMNPIYSSSDGVLFSKSQSTLLQCPEGRSGSYRIPNGVITIEGDAFSGCSRLTDVTIPDSVTGIGGAAFYGCRGLTNLTVANSVTNIGRLAFCLCEKLTTVTLPDGVTSIADYTFQDCYSLTKIMIGKRVTSIGEGAFVSCTSLSDVAIPNGVTGIDWFAFAGTGLRNVVIPQTVSSIGWSAFASCAELQGIYFNGNAPTLGSYVFASDPKAVVYYVPGTTGWGVTFGELPTAVWQPRIETNDASFGIRTNQFGFNIYWASGMTVVVEGSIELIDSTWLPLATNFLVNGTSYFIDPAWTNYPTRFYRIRSP